VLLWSCPANSFNGKKRIKSKSSNEEGGGEWRKRSALLGATFGNLQGWRSIT
jgi:hypothetical protein